MGVSKKTIQKFIDGDENATGEIFEEFKNLLFFIISSYISNIDDAKDVLSETFIEAMEHRNEVKDPRKIKSFLSAIAKNKSINFLKKKKAEVIENIDERYAENDKGNVLLDLFGPLLSNKETIVLCYRAAFSYSWKEIREETGIPESTSKLLYSRAKEKLRKELL